MSVKHKYSNHLLNLSQALAASGANVLLHGLMEPAAADALATKISLNYSVKAAVSTHDLSRADDVDKMVSSCVEKLGPVDILVNNAGIQVREGCYCILRQACKTIHFVGSQHVSPIEEFSKDMFDKVIAVNLTAPWLASKAVLPAMRRRKYGRIVNIASVHGLVVRRAAAQAVVQRLCCTVVASCNAGQREQVSLRCQ